MRADAAWWRILVILILAGSVPTDSRALPARVAQAPTDTARARRPADSVIQAGGQTAAAPVAGSTGSDTGSESKAPAQSGADGFVLIARATAFFMGLIVLIGLGSITLRFGGRTLAALDERLPVGVRTHWGDFGGGNAGWQMSPALSLLLGTIVLAIATAAVTAVLLVTAPTSPNPPNPDSAVSPSANADSLRPKP